MTKSCLITVLALIASVSAKPYVYSYGTLPYVPRAAYTTSELYNPPTVATLPAAYSTAYSAGYSAGYPTAYSSYPASYAPAFPGAYPASLQLPAVSAYGSSYTVEQLAPLYNPVAAIASVAPVAPVSPVAPLSYASPYTYSYFYKR